MKTNHYESVVIFNATLEDEQIETTITRIKDLIAAHGGEITEIDNWGRKRLAYPIQKAKSGYYSVIRFKAPTDLIANLERSFRLDETIIRYLTVVLDKNALEAYAKQKEAARESNEEKAVETSTEETAKVKSEE